MWLLDTTSLRLCQVSDATAGTYAILSHTWDGDDEISFQDIQNIEKVRMKSGLNKIEKTCEIAKARHLRHAWVDTCCIDKTSSAELSEAINSMFSWYRDSKICYVYLSDFEPLPFTLTEVERLQETGARLDKCRWFTRGWTLQELIAPRAIEFFDRDWNFIGGKEDLIPYLSRITNIDDSVLTDSSGLQRVPVARKMSWASGRETTRLEDRAYSLLGLFDIHMPLIYGEGFKSFIRLQQQIATENNDLSLFAWSDPQTSCSSFSGILATSPDQFSHCSSLRMHTDQFETIRELAITNSGLRMKKSLLCADPDVHGAYLLGLNCVECSVRTNQERKWLAIRLTKVGSIFLRTQSDSFVVASDRKEWWRMQRQSHTKDEDFGADIYIQTMLQKHDAHRFQSLMSKGITIVYGGTIVNGIRSRSGAPIWSCSNNHEKEVFVFDASGQDNFLGIHFFEVPVPEVRDVSRSRKNVPMSKFMLVCSLQWDGAEYQLVLCLFPFPEDRPHGTRGGGNNEEELLKHVKDGLFMNFSDSRGLLVQNQMPRARPTFLLGRSGTLVVRPLESHEKGLQLGSYKWKPNYHHVHLEHSLVGQAIPDSYNGPGINYG